jgi:hypothetical protein
MSSLKNMCFYLGLSNARQVSHGQSGIGADPASATEIMAFPLAAIWAGAIW